ncbi:MAG: hypothetical protein QOE35_4037 [Actinomycetota bacterium]
MSERDDHHLGDELGRVAAGEKDAMARVTRALARSARVAGTGAVASGRWLAEVVLDTAPRIPIRDQRTLETHHDGLTGAALAEALITTASRASAGVGAAAGALMSAEELSPPTWLAIPLELVVETLAVAAVELKLVAELHEAYGRPVPGSSSERSMAVVRAWAERRGVTPAVLTRRGGLADVLGRGTRNELLRLVRRRMVARMGRNLSSLAPLFAGVVAGAEVNRRATRALGEAVVRDLASGA